MKQPMTLAELKAMLEPSMPPEMVTLYINGVERGLQMAAFAMNHLLTAPAPTKE